MRKRSNWDGERVDWKQKKMSTDIWRGERKDYS